MSFKHVLCAVLFLFLVGCSFGDLLPSNKIEYKSAGKAPTLEVPPDLTRPGRDDRYAVPETASGIGGTTATTYNSYNASRNNAARSGPSNSDVLPNAEKVRMQSTGGERWLVIDEPPEKVWPAVKEFWQENGFLLQVEMPDVGVMETDWAENRAKIADDPVRKTLGKFLDQIWSTGERDKYRTRLERTADGRGTEVYISHRGMVEEFVPGTNNERTVWQPRPSDPELEAEFLHRLMVRLGVDDSKARALLTTAATPLPARAKMVSADGVNMLSVAEPFDRAWRRVGLALDRVGFTVEDRDRSKGTYYVRYVDPQTDQKKADGFLSKLAFWRSDEKAVNKAAQYRVVVRQAGDASQVSVLNKDGQPDNSETPRKILSLLQEQLK